MKKTFFLFVLIFGFNYVNGQGTAKNVFDLKNMSATSPDAAMLARFGDIPIGHYTGTTNISVPLYTISEAGLDIPVVLTYHSSGIKVEDESGWVGLGWSLEPAGSITQSVNGKEDDLDYLHQRDGYDFLKDGMLLGSYSEKLTDNTQDALRFARVGEGQPDYYYCSFPGFSGKFYINKENGEVVFVNKTVPITVLRTGLGWLVTTMEGNKFHFTVRETVASPTITEYVGYSWKLSKIQLHTGREINFGYSDGYYQSNAFSQTWHDPYPSGLGSGSTESTTLPSYHQVKYLSSISSGNLKAEFLLEDRDDLFYATDNDGISGNGSLSTKRLKTLVIKDSYNNTNIKSFDFNYGYFAYSQVGGSYLNVGPGDMDKVGKRLKLMSIRENGYTNVGALQTGPSYVFEYEESILLPLKTSFARDFWGYYNGKNNTSLLPDLSYYRFSGFPEYQSIPLYVLNSYGHAANRSANASVIKAGILKRIQYPTGGHSIFNYEPNSFSNFNYPDVEQITQLTTTGAVEDKNNTNDIYSKQFTIPNSLTAHFTASINRGPNMSRTFEEMLPSTVTLTRIGSGGSNITPIKTWQMLDDLAHRTDFASDGVYTWNLDIDLVYVPNTYYVLIANLPNGLGAQNTSTNSASVSASYSFAAMANTTAKLSFGAGLRTQSIQHFTSEGNVATQKYFDYTKDGITSGLLMSPLKHFYSKQMHFSRLYEVPGNQQNPQGSVYAENTTQDIWFVSSNSYVPFSDAASGNMVGYGSVQETDHGDGTTNGSRRLHFHNAQSNTKINNPEIADQRNGLLLREDLLKLSGDTVRKTLYSYIEKEAKFFRGFKIFDNFVGSDPPQPGDPGYGHTFYPSGKRYSINSYPNNAQWFVMDRKINFDHFTTGIVKSQEDFTYNSLGQTIVLSKANSKGQLETINHKYPVDVSGSPTGVEQQMRDQFLFNSVLETHTTVAGVETSRVKNNYQHFSGSPVTLLSTETSFGGGPFKEEVRYTSYGDFKQPTSILRNGLKSVLIWSYNSLYPIAKIDNAELSTIAGILGEQTLIDFMRNSSPSASTINSFIAPLRSSTLLKDAHITTYVYQPWIGVSMQTDPKGMSTSYTYDSFGRLEYVKDYNGHIVKAYQYHYKP